jgi:hypothetical protein
MTSAKIYEFPARGRFALTAERDEKKSVANFMSPRIANIGFGSSWYHEEAIREDEPARKN